MQELWQVKYSYLIPLLPLIGSAIAGFFGARLLKGRSHWPIWLSVGASAVISVLLLVSMLSLQGGHEQHDALSGSTTWFNWISIGDFSATAGAFIDPLTAVMLCVICGIGFLITVFAAGYMKGEEGYFRFFAWLGLFIFAMTILVLGNNFIMLYLGWEGVGLCSYLLIGHYYERPSAREAAKKAFLVNRVGDFGFGIGIMLIFLTFGTVSFFGDGPGTGTGVLEMASNPEFPAKHAKALQWIPFLLMLGAFGKSAQFPLHVWLPDAMEGPTPVSALIHAATMVTAGVYMIARCSTLFVANQAAINTIAVIGLLTALMAATIALRQFDLKKVFAYSTISQLGFMFVAVGVLAPVAGVFHLVTHAFFKALLFLSSGVVMHAMLGELDMRKMSGLKHVLPRIRWLMLIGCLALAGLIPFSGFWSKDEIVAAAFGRFWLIGVLLLLTALLTSYYTFRLYFRVFEGPLVIPERPAQAHAGHEPDPLKYDQEPQHDQHSHEPAIMILPLIVLAIGAVVAGFVNFPHAYLGEFLGRSPSFILGYKMLPAGEAPPTSFGQHGEHHIHVEVIGVSIVVALFGIFLAYLMHLHKRSAAEQAARMFPNVTRLLEAKYWIDEVYQSAIVEPLRSLGRLFFAMDNIVIDGLLLVLSYTPVVSAFVLKKTVQRGYLQGYASAMLFGVLVILVLVFW